MSDASYIIRAPGDDRILAVWGWKRQGSIAGGGINAWMLSMEGIEDHKVFAARMSRSILDMLLEQHPHVWAMVHEDHTLAQRWLRWLGFARDWWGPEGWQRMSVYRGGMA